MVRVSVDESGTREDGLALWPVYESVFGDHPDIDSWLAGVWDRHRARPGFRLARSYAGEVLTGFAYGYTGEYGQWWTDHVRDAIRAEVAEEWLGGHFELVSIGVTQDVRGQGVGRTLMRTLCDGLPHERLLLMTTADPGDPARHLYESEGWRVLGPGVGDATVTMGRVNHAAAERREGR